MSRDLCTTLEQDFAIPFQLDHLLQPSVNLFAECSKLTLVTNFTLTRALSGTRLGISVSLAFILSLVIGTLGAFP